jgi:hypothetical protein
MDAELGRSANSAVGTDRGAFARRISTETKAAYKTTEFLTYVVVGLAKSVAASPTTTATAARRLRAAPT